jgi:hypothetical protein
MPRTSAEKGERRMKGHSQKEERRAKEEHSNSWFLLRWRRQGDAAGPVVQAG